jgi:hypothetical protein
MNLAGLISDRFVQRSFILMKTLYDQGMVLFLGEAGYGRAGNKTGSGYPDGEGPAMGTELQGAYIIFVLDGSSCQCKGNAHGKACFTETEDHVGFSSNPLIVIRCSSRKGHMKENLAGPPDIDGYGNRTSLG